MDRRQKIEPMTDRLYLTGGREHIVTCGDSLFFVPLIVAQRSDLCYTMHDIIYQTAR